MQHFRKLLHMLCLVSAPVLLQAQVADHLEIGSSGFDLVKTGDGYISGGVSADGIVHYFKGIPFAAPPVGDLRWKAPQPVVPWQGVRACDTFSASPMQSYPVPFGPWTAEYLISPKPISEDCLYLNVWTGAATPTAKLPVLVWIYGGGFVSGGSNVPVYDGEALARKGIIFVSINYRVGIFGFFAHPGLTREAGYHASGNYGLLDQIAALKWVRKNIAAFGGDPGRITIAGQSAGSMSVNYLVASPLAKDLFQHAIAESGSRVFDEESKPVTLATAEQQGVELARNLQVTSLEALRKLPAEELLKKAKGDAFPIVDGYVVPEPLGEIFAAGKENPVSLLTGWNLDDIAQFGKFKSAAGFKQEVTGRFGNAAEKLLTYYPAATDSEAAISQESLARDEMFGIQNGTWANLQAGTGQEKVYVYFFKRKVPATGDYIRYGAFHTGEVAYALDNLKFLKNRPLTKEDENLAKIMSAYWVNFVRTGNPNGPGLPQWPAYDQKDAGVMLLDTKPVAGTLPDKAGIDFLYQYYKNQHR